MKGANQRVELQHVVIRHLSIDNLWFKDLISAAAGKASNPREREDSMARRLGKGLGSLLGDHQAAPANEPGDRHEIALSDIVPNPFQPRRVFDPEGLEELRTSIQRHGVLQPVVVRAAAGGYQLVSGERRWRASQMAGLNRIPAVVREVLDDDMLELALVENVQRRDLDPIERAQGYRDLMDRLNLTQQAVAERVGLQRATVANHLRLLELPEKVQEALGKGLISMGHARALLGLADAPAMEALLGQIVRKDLSVREVERLVRARAGRGTPSGSNPAVPAGAPPWVRDVERRMRDHLGAKVVLEAKSGDKGRIVIDYSNRAELDRLIAALGPRNEF